MQQAPQRLANAVDVYHIGDVAKMVGVSRATLRLWESSGLIQPARTAGGYRAYSSRDVARLKWIQQLREDGINIAGIHTILESAGEGGEPVRHVTALDDEMIAGNILIGRHLRQLRTSMDLKLAEVAERSGLSISFISLVERGMSGISAGSLDQLCRALGTNRNAILGADQRPPRRMIAAGCGYVLPTLDPGIHIEQLIEGVAHFNCSLITYAPHHKPNAEFVNEGEGYIYMLEGRLAVRVRGETYLLSAGDCIYLERNSHVWENPDDKPAKILWVNVFVGN